MNRIGKYIADLLPEHDCVVVPGLGGFVANYAPAGINTSRHFIFPPSKKIVFNRKLKNNDGLLAEYISATESISFTDAVILLNRFSDDVIQRLEKGEAVSVKEVGILAMGAEKNISFEPDTTRNLLISSFGLESIQALPVKREERKIEKEIFVNRGAKPVDRKTVLKRVTPYVAVPLLVLFMWLPFATGVIKDGNTNFSRINPFYNAPPPVYQPAGFFEAYEKPIEYASLFDYEAAGKTVKYSFVENTVADSISTGVIVSLGEAVEEYSSDELVPAVTTSKIVSQKKYHIIAGAFKYNDLAELLVADLRKKGFDAYILNEPSEPLEKVCYEGFPARNEALEKLREIQNENPDAWVYRKD